ncbi:MAG: MFS transporter [Chloroflexota bacterium]
MTSFFTKMQAFYAIMAGQIVSTVGSSMTRFGLSIWVLNQTGDTVAYSILLFFSILPLGLGSLFAGPFVDRWNRRWVLISSDAIASLSTLVVALLYFADALALWHLYVAVAVNGVASSFSGPALEASVPLLVKQERLGQASGLMQMSNSVQLILGPVLGGLLVGTVGLGAIFLVDFVTFAASITALALSVIPQPPRPQAQSPQESFWQEFLFGIRYVWRRPTFLYLMSIVTLAMLLMPGVGYALSAPIVLSFANEIAVGFAHAAFGIGALLGGFLLTIWGGPKRRMHGLLASMGLASVAFVLVGLWESVTTISLGYLLIGITFVFVLGLNRVIWQLKAAPDVLGRVVSLRTALGVGARSLGVLAAGPMAERFFEPLFMDRGSLVGNVGQFIGTGPGRGMALMFILVGLLLGVLAVVSYLAPRLRMLEDLTPDFVPTVSAGAD